jgi:hypothetical protein
MSASKMRRTSDGNRRDPNIWHPRKPFQATETLKRLSMKRGKQGNVSDFVSDIGR